MDYDDEDLTSLDMTTLLAEDMTPDGTVDMCRFCHHGLNHVNYGHALRICNCTHAADFMAHRGCFYAHVLKNDAPPVCHRCQAPWCIPPVEYMPFYYHRKRVKVYNLQVLAIRTLLAVAVAFVMALAAAFIVKGAVYVVSGSPVYRPFQAASLEVHWEPGLGDLVVGFACAGVLLLAVLLARAVYRRFRRGGGYRPAPPRGDETELDDLANRMKHYNKHRYDPMNPFPDTGAGTRSVSAALTSTLSSSPSVKLFSPRDGDDDDDPIGNYTPEVGEYDDDLSADAVSPRTAFDLPLSDYESEDSA